MAGKVLDSSLLLAYFRDNPSAEAFEQVLIAASRRDVPLQLSHVGFAELMHTILRESGADAWAEVSRVLQGMPIELQPTTRTMAEIAAEYQARHGLRMADAFAAALARERKAELVTAGTAFEALAAEIKVNAIGQ